MRKKYFGVLFTIVFMSSIILSACGGGGGPKTPPTTTPPTTTPPTTIPPSGITLSGTAATGQAIANATVTVKGRNGVSKTGTTDANGNYTIDVGGLAAPFLLKINLPAGGVLFSVGSEAGVVNIHPLTDLIVTTWYKIKGLTVAATFDTLSSATPVPTKVEVQTITRVVVDITSKWLVDNGIDPNTIDPITTPFVANGAGFDRVLDLTAVSADGGTVTIKDNPGAPTSTQTSGLTIDPVSGSVTVDTTTVAPGGTVSTSTNRVLVPTTNLMQEAVNGVNALLLKIKDKVTLGAGNLADGDIIPFLSADFLEDGQDRAVFAARVAGRFRGSTVNGFRIDRVISFDEATQTLNVTASILFTGNNVAGREIFKTAFQQVGGVWFWHGNGRIAKVIIQVEMRTDITGTGSIPRRLINVDVDAPVGTIATVSVDGAGVFTATNVAKNPQLRVETLQPTPNGPVLTLQKDVFSAGADFTTAFPPPETILSITVTPVGGAPVTYTDVIRGTTTETVSLRGLTGNAMGNTLAAANSGGPLSVSWTLPKLFPVALIDLSAQVSSLNFQATVVPAIAVGPTSTSATLTLPTTTNGEPVTRVSLHLVINGPNGERIHIMHVFEGGGAVTPPPVAIASISVTPATGAISIGGTQQFTAVAKDAVGTAISGVVFSWASSNIAVATVNTGSGLSTGVSAGAVTITASAGGVTSNAANLTVTAVAPPPAVIASISVTPVTATVSVGTPQQFAAVAKDAAGSAISGVVFTWASSNIAVATVNAGSGLATGISAGAATITAASGGITSNAANLTVTATTAVNVGTGFENVGIGISFPDAQTGGVSGRVRRADNGISLSGVTIRALLSGIEVASTTTQGALGRYTLTNLPPDIYVIEASKTGFALSSATNVQVQAGSETIVTDILLGP